MGQLWLKGEPACGTSNKASAISFTDNLENASTVQNGLKDILGDFATELSSLVAPSGGLAKGDYILYNHKLYKVTKNGGISGGASFTTSDISATNVGKEVSSLNSDLSNKMPKVIHGSGTWFSSFDLELTAGIYVFMALYDLYFIQCYAGGTFAIAPIKFTNWTLSGTNYKLSGTSSNSGWYCVIKLN